MKLFRCIALLGLLTTLTSAQAEDIDYDFAPAKQAIIQMKALPGAVDRVINVVNATHFGPFPLSGSCDYDSNWWSLGMPTKTFHWNWSPNYSWLKDNLRGHYQNVKGVAGQFGGRFDPVRNWLEVTLPSFSKQFDQQAVQMLAAEAVLGNPAASPEDKANAAETISSAFSIITASLQKDTTELSTGVSNLANLNRQLGAYIDEINELKSQMDNMLAAGDAQFQSEIAGWPDCGRNQILGQYADVKGTVRSQFDDVMASGTQFGVTADNVDKAISLILGSVVNIQNNYYGVLQNLRNAQITPQGAVQVLRIRVAQSAWKNLADFAREQLN